MGEPTALGNPEANCCKPLGHHDRGRPSITARRIPPRVTPQEPVVQCKPPVPRWKQGRVGRWDTSERYVSGECDGLTALNRTRLSSATNRVSDLFGCSIASAAATLGSERAVRRYAAPLTS